MTEGIIQKVFERKSKQMADWYAAFAIEELKHELITEIKKELDSYPFRKSYEISMFKQWLIGDS
ncbi:MAG: hypothetical protein ACREBU_11480 [Nitrososphaera sp.]